MASSLDRLAPPLREAAGHAAWIRRGTLLGAALGLTAVTWQVPRFVPSVGFDHSWQLALHLAAMQELDFGRDVVFTYGPLGFLSQPLVVSGWTGGASFAYVLVAQVVLAAVVYLTAARLYGRVGGLLVAFAALGLTLLPSDVPVYLAFFAVVAVLQADEPPGARLLVPLAGVAAAFELLVKLNSGVVCLVLLALAVWRLPPRGVRAELLLLASFAVALVVLWLATGNPLAALPVWLRESRHLLSGYTDAVALALPKRAGDRIAAALLVGAFVALLVPLLRRLPRRRAVPLALAAVLYLFAYMKEGFVREDLHVLSFFGAVGVGVLAFARRGRARWGALAVVAGAVAAGTVTPNLSERVHYRPLDRARTAVLEARDAVDPAARRRDLAAARARARADLAVPPAMLRLLRGRTVDVVPYETSAVWAYGLDWRPEPLLQWYTAFDGRLDRVNAERLADHGAERILRQRVLPLDAKIAAFEAPATYLALLCNYRELAADGSWEVLARTDNRCGTPAPLGRAIGHAGDEVPVPRAPRRDELVYARIRFPHSLGGRLQSFLFKPLHVPQIQTGATFRFVPQTAGGPLVLRLPASGGISPLYGGYTAYDWFALRHVPGPFAVEFFALPIHGRAALALPTTTPAGRLDGRALVVAGRRYRLAPHAFEGWVDTAAPAGTTGVVAGWALDPRGGRPAPLVAGFDGDRLVALTRPAQARPDVAQGLRLPHAGTSGYSFVFPLHAGGTHLRVFALGGGAATELTYAAGYRWRPIR